MRLLYLWKMNSQCLIFQKDAEALALPAGYILDLQLVPAVIPIGGGLDVLDLVGCVCVCRAGARQGKCRGSNRRRFPKSFGTSFSAPVWAWLKLSPRCKFHSNIHNGPSTGALSSLGPVVSQGALWPVGILSFISLVWKLGVGSPIILYLKVTSIVVFLAICLYLQTYFPTISPPGLGGRTSSRRRRANIHSVLA